MTMTPTQREAAMRLADELQRFDGAERESLRDEAAALLRELAQEPQSEPVAWLYEAKSGASFVHRDFTNVRFEADMRAAKEYPDGHKMTPLYAHPPQQRKPLSDYEIDRAWIQRDCLAAIQAGDILAQVRSFVRSVERALGIGEAP